MQVLHKAILVYTRAIQVLKLIAYVAEGRVFESWSAQRLLRFVYSGFIGAGYMLPWKMVMQIPARRQHRCLTPSNIFLFSLFLLYVMLSLQVLITIHHPTFVKDVSLFWLNTVLQPLLGVGITQLSMLQHTESEQLRLFSFPNDWLSLSLS